MVGRAGSGSNSTVTSPPQHCRPNSVFSCGLSRVVTVDTSADASVIMVRARVMATSSRLPPPMLPQVRAEPDHHLGAGVAGRVPADGDHRDQHPGLAGVPQLRCCS